jgi:IS5 family transposase
MAEQTDFFFGIQNLYDQLSKLGDPLEVLAKNIPWDRFRPKLGLARLTANRKSNAGRKPYDDVLMFKTLVLQALYNLSDDQTEYQIRDRLSFRRFLDLGMSENVPDAKTIWLFREHLVQKKLVEKLFAKFDGYLNEMGFAARGGQIIDASFVQVPKQRNKKDENDQIKAGQTPEQWKEQPAKLRQKDVDACWTKKNDETYYGYKNHINVDNNCKLIRVYAVTDASVHDSQAFYKLIDPTNANANVHADSAYRSKEVEAELKEAGYRSKIHFKAYRNKPLTRKQENANHSRSKVRARVEHVFGYQANSMKAGLIKTIGIARAKAKIGMNNLVYNMQRFLQLQRIYRINPC